ncbi:MAG: molybdenum cofactor guanylyltransferase [Thermosynechococcaceae cyanobacterium]
MTHPPLVSALILAGGHSSRMGSDKALLSWQGLPLLERVCDVAMQCCADVAVLSPWPERYHDLLDPSVQLIEEVAPHEGPLVALYQGLELMPAPWLLLLACDLPCLEPQILQEWAAHLQPQSLAQVPYYQGRWEPLCGFYHQQCKPQLQAFIEQGGRSFQKWLNQMPVQKLEVDVAISPMLRNCNTPADLEPGIP